MIRTRCCLGPPLGLHFLIVICSSSFLISLILFQIRTMLAYFLVLVMFKYLFYWNNLLELISSQFWRVILFFCSAHLEEGRGIISLLFSCIWKARYSELTILKFLNSYMLCFNRGSLSNVFFCVLHRMF